jgi:sterol desaturase/sphingolipid hydroxylase (fatty acid hydroxylase superfamily)
MIDLLYQFWVHTQQVGRLGWFDRWFCSPSNHRAHHAVNDRYLDKNYGGILIIWDRLFGTFVEEDDADPCVYGTRAPLRSWDPIAANVQVYRLLWADCRRAARWGDKLRIWFKPPGWRPADVAAHWPKPAFDLALARATRYAPPQTPNRLALAAALFVAVLVATLVLLWNAGAWPTAWTLLLAALIVATLAGVARLTSGPGGSDPALQTARAEHA